LGLFIYGTWGGGTDFKGTVKICQYEYFISGFITHMSVPTKVTDDKVMDLKKWLIYILNSILSTAGIQTISQVG
jgi:hypothetical protein